MSMMVESAIEQKAYLEYYGEYEPEDFEYDDDAYNPWKNKEVEIWEGIQGLNFVVWGPMFILGCLSLSGMAEEQTAWWAENVVSNLQMIVMIDGTYSLLEYAMLEGGW